MTDKSSAPLTSEEAYAAELRNGVWIFFLLAIFTVGEFIAALVAPALGWMLIIVALPKVFFVVTEYMHVRRLFQSETEGHS